jgi:N-acetylglucosaminyldiphosphoundecaprenol N-acetyl-beta-D-mannosaminyltransferase
MHSPNAKLNIEAVASPFCWPDDLEREIYDVCGAPIDVIDMEATVQKIRTAAKTATPFLSSTVNVNYLVASQSDVEFRKSLLFSDLCTADGMPIVWMARLLGIPIKERVAGADVFEALKFSRDSSRQLKVFLFGGADSLAARACKIINAASSDMRCVGSLNPGFCAVDEMSTDPIIEQINSSGADLLVVALGAEKGQAWLKQNHDRLRVPVRVHIGAALKFQAGAVRRAPIIMQKLGFEWLWRIKEEPHLWKRYLKDGMVLLRLLLTHVLPHVIRTRWHRLWSARNEQDLLIAGSEDDESVTLSLKGAATFLQVEKARLAFQNAIIAEKPVIINFADTCQIDARFIGLLIMLNKRLMRRQLPLRFTQVPRRIGKIIRLNGLGFMLPHQA